MIVRAVGADPSIPKVGDFPSPVAPLSVDAVTHHPNGELTPWSFSEIRKALWHPDRHRTGDSREPGGVVTDKVAAAGVVERLWTTAQHRTGRLEGYTIIRIMGGRSVDYSKLAGLLPDLLIDQRAEMGIDVGVVRATARFTADPSGGTSESWLCSGRPPVAHGV
jgi:hypothetical protein